MTGSDAEPIQKELTMSTSDGADATSATFIRTRASLHAVAEHVLAAARYQATGRIGLAVTPGGFGTPPFRTASVDGAAPENPTRTVAVAAAGDDAGVELVVRAGEQLHRAPLTTLRAAAALAGITLGGPAEVYRLSTPLEPDAPLRLDADAARRIADWYALGDAALRQWHAEIADDDPSDITLWPEHADVALRAADINYGASPGDSYIADPYLYVGPPTIPSDDTFWNAPFGAYLVWEKARSTAEALAFFREGRRRIDTRLDRT
jgi:hypothetical protein